MASSKKKTKKRGKKSAKTTKPESTEAEREAKRIASRPPLLRLVFAMAELLLMPPPEGDHDHIYGKARDELEERRRATLVRAACKADRFQWGTERLSLDDVREDLEDVIVGGPSSSVDNRTSPARLEARELAQRIVDRVFNLKETRLKDLVPGMMRELKAEADAKRKAEDDKRRAEEAARRKKWQEEAAARAKKSSRAKKAAKTRKSPAMQQGAAARREARQRDRAAKKTTKASPAKSSTKKPSDPAPKAAKRTSSAKKAAKSSTPASSPATSTSKPATTSKPDATTRARCMELHPQKKERCMHTQGHDVDEQPHETIGGDQW